MGYHHDVEKINSCIDSAGYLRFLHNSSGIRQDQRQVIKKLYQSLEILHRTFKHRQDISRAKKDISTILKFSPHLVN